MAEALVDRIDRTVDQLLARADASAALQDPTLSALARIANELRTYPRTAFKARLRADLERRTTMDLDADDGWRRLSSEGGRSKL